jgi:HEAT repeat protein
MVSRVARLFAVGLALGLVGAVAAGCSPSVSELKAKADVDGLIAVLRGFGDDADDAANALGELGDARAVPALTDAISAGGETSTAAVDALGKIKDTSAVPALIEVLEDLATTPDEVRAHTAATLGAIGDRTAIPALLDVASRAGIQDATVLAAALDSLATLGPEADRQSIEALLAAATEQPALADAVDRVIAGMGPAGAEELVTLLRDNAYRTGATDALVRWGAAAVGSLVSALGSANDDDFFTLVGVLERIRDPSVATALVGLLRGDDPEAQVAGIRALALVGSSGAATAIVPMLKSSASEVRLAAIEALGTLGDPAATDALVKLLKDKDVKVRTAAAKALGELGDRDATKALVASLKDAKLSAAAALALAKLYKDDPDKLLPYLKAKATVGVYYGLIRIGADSTIPGLVKALNSFGTKDMAVDYLNCGSTKLEDAAHAWAKKHGYEVVTQPGGGSVQWGSGL